MKRPIGMTLAAMLFPLVPVQAADFRAPEGCETFLTVQSKQCAVTNLYRCDVAPDGTFWEALFSADGMESVVSYDRDYQWIEANYFWDNSREAFSPPAEDRISFDALTSDGVDTFRFVMRRTAPGESRNITVVGADILTDKMVEIDGTALRLVQTQIQILAADGSVEYDARGVQYVDMERRLFFAGTEEVLETTGDVSVYDGSPVDFIHPGEPGFGATVPLYECVEQEASLPPGSGKNK